MAERRAPTFTPRFDFTAREVLEVLTTGHLLDTSGTTGPALQSLLPPALHEPNLDVLAALTEGIHRGLVVTIDYCSLTSGDKTRDIARTEVAEAGLHRIWVCVSAAPCRRFHDGAFPSPLRQIRSFIMAKTPSNHGKNWTSGAIAIRRNPLIDGQK